jgi:OOP family OmpA-OmpF porin
MIDLNKNNVPDEVEAYLKKRYEPLEGNIDLETNTYKLNKSSKLITKSINEGFVSVLFDSKSSKPSNISADSINYILIYLNNNPSKFIEIIGHSDEMATSKLNEKLAINRANAVKNILIKSGIEAERLNVVTEVEDNSLDTNSTLSRSLVRRVTFKIK